LNAKSRSAPAQVSRQAAAGRMSAIIAHEIRNPLAAISGSVQVLKSELSLTEEQSRLMSIVVSESRRVSQSIDQFLNLAAPGSGTSAGAVTLGATDKDVVTGITQVAASGKSISYSLAATVAAGVVASSTKTVTLTLTDGA